MLEVVVEPAPSSSFLEHPNVRGSAEDVINALALLGEGNLPPVSPEFLSEFEKAGVLAIVDQKHFGAVQVIDSFRRALLDDSRPDDHGLKAKLVRTDLYPTYRHDYARHGDTRVALTQAGRALLKFAETAPTTDRQFFELWENFTIQEGTLFKRAATPSLVREFTEIRRDLSDAFADAKCVSLSPTNLDRLYPNLMDAVSRLDILVHNLLHHPRFFGYRSRPDSVVTEKLTKLFRAISKLAVEIRPYIINPNDGREHVQADDPGNLIQKQVMASRRFFDRETGILLGTAAAKA